MQIFKKELSINGAIILGSPRSGTTLLRRLLDSHHEISCPGETFLFKAAAGFLDYDTISGGFDYGVLGALEGLGYERGEILSRLRHFSSLFYEEIAEKEGKKVWVAKTAIDSFYIPQIETLFAGEVKFICVLRHGLDVVCSMEEFCNDLQSYISELHKYIKQYPQPYVAFAHAWADATTNILDFVKRQDQDCIVLKYEDLVENPDEKLSELTSFLGVSDHKHKSEQILKNKNIGGIGDWKSFKKDKVENTSIGRWQQHLQDATVDMLAPIVSPVLERAGYDAIGSDDSDALRRQELAKMLMQAKSE